MTTLEWICKKNGFSINGQRLPIQIPNVGRNDLAGWFAELGFKIIVEIGVRRADYTKILCERNSQAQVYGVDPWQPYEEYTAEIQESYHRIALEKLAPWPNGRILRTYSAFASTLWEANSIDAVYIDGNHAYESVMEDIGLWSQVVRPGGIISGHDYKPLRNPHERIEVYEAVNAYTAMHKIAPWFVLGSRRSIPEETRDNPRSWFWVKR